MSIWSVFTANPNDIVGHLSYIMLAISFLITNMFWLRVWACSALFLEIIYFSMTTSALYTGVGWNVLFILINLYRLWGLGWCSARLRRFEELRLLKRVFAGLDDVRLARLVQAANWSNFPPGRPILAADEEIIHVHLVCAGSARSSAIDGPDGRYVVGDLIGADAIIEEAFASASVVAEAPTRTLSFASARLSKLCREDSAIYAAMLRVAGKDLARRLRHSQGRAVWPEVTEAVFVVEARRGVR